MFVKSFMLLCLLLIPVVTLAVGFSSFFGGTDGTGVSDVAVDSVGCVYICGYTVSTNMPVTPGAYQPTNKNLVPTDWIGDIYVAKLDQTLTHLIFCTYIGGTGDDYPKSIKVDNNRNIYVGGYSSSTDFPTTLGVLQTVKSAYEDGFVFKMNATGTALVFSTYLGGNSIDNINEIAIDSAGNIFIDGDTISTDLPVSATAKQTTNGGGRDAFAAKMNSTGTALDYLTYIGGNNYDYSYGFAVDAQGNAYVCGPAYSTNFPITTNAKQTVLSGPGTTDVFVTKVNPSGTDFVYSTFIGGTGYDSGEDVAVDTQGFAYVVGRTNSTNYPITAGAPQAALSGSYDMVITKINQDGSDWVYSTYLGGTNDEYPNAINVNSNDQAYIVGYTMSSATFPITSGAYQEISKSNYTGFMTILNAAGTAWVYSTFLGGNVSDNVNNITFNSTDIPYLCGDAYSGDFPVTPNAFDQVIDTTNGDGFVLKFEIPFNTDPLIPVELSEFHMK